MAAAALIALAALALACEHGPPDPEVVDPLEDVQTLARRLLVVEMATHQLIAWAKTPGVPDMDARLEALEALVEHIRRTTGFLEESLRNPAREKAARAGVRLASLAYDFMWLDAEGTARKERAVVRPSCNRGLAWVGVGMQGLEKDPAWADDAAELRRVYVNAESIRENLYWSLELARIMRAGVDAANVYTAVYSGAVLTGAGLSAIERLAAFVARGGGAPVALRVVPSVAGGAALELVSPVAATATVTLTHAEAIALVAAGQLGGSAAALYMMASGLPPKPVDPKAFAEWIERAPKKQTPTTSAKYEYEIRKTGPKNITVSGGGTQISADGARVSDAHLLEAKHVGEPGRSPFIEGSRCPEAIRAKVLKDLTDEFRRYAAVIRDPEAPAVGLEVIVNDARAVPYFERLMKQFGIPGQVVVSP